jgi:hypothetical protein
MPDCAKVIDECEEFFYEYDSFLLATNDLFSDLKNLKGLKMMRSETGYMDLFLKDLQSFKLKSALLDKFNRYRAGDESNKEQLAASICNQIISIRHKTILTTIARRLGSSFSRMARRGSKTQGAMGEIMEETSNFLKNRKRRLRRFTVSDNKVTESCPRSSWSKSSRDPKSGDRFSSQREISTSPGAQHTDSRNQLPYDGAYQKTNLRLETALSSPSADYKSQNDSSNIAFTQSRPSRRRISRYSKPLNVEFASRPSKQGPISFRESLEGEPLDNHHNLIASVARRRNKRSVDASLPTIRSNDMNATDHESIDSSHHGLQSTPSLKEDDIATLEKMVNEALAESNNWKTSLDQDRVSRRLSDNIFSSDITFEIGDTTTVFRSTDGLFALKGSRSTVPTLLSDDMLPMNLTNSFP